LHQLFTLTGGIRVGFSLCLGRAVMQRKMLAASLATAGRLVSTYRLRFFMPRFKVLGRENDFAATHLILSRRFAITQALSARRPVCRPVP
jgi:hypothetical protein